MSIDWLQPGSPFDPKRYGTVVALVVLIAGIFLLVLIDASRLTALPVGLWAALPPALLALLLWTVWRPRR